MIISATTICLSLVQLAAALLGAFSLGVLFLFLASMIWHRVADPLDDDTQADCGADGRP